MVAFWTHQYLSFKYFILQQDVQWNNMYLQISKNSRTGTVPICIWCVIYLMCSPEPAQTARRRFPHLVYTKMEWIKNELRKSSIFDWVSAANRHLLTEIGPEAMVGSIDLSNIRQQQWLPSP